MRTRRTLRLVGESLREVAVLVGVFMPLDYLIEGRLTLELIFFTVVVSGGLLTCGIFLETRP